MGDDDDRRYLPGDDPDQLLALETGLTEPIEGQNISLRRAALKKHRSRVKNHNSTNKASFPQAKGALFAFLQPPEKFEAGTLNIEGIYGLGAAIEYLENIGMENIEKYEKELRNYAISKFKSLQILIIYNEFAEGSFIKINVKDVFAQDEASYLNSKGLCVRSGEHCAKILHDFLKTVATVRISFSFYNTKEEIDILYEALKNGGDFLDAYFN